jgi:hypothetical protein
MMNRRTLLGILALCAGLPVAADPVAAGKYTGKWEGASGASGDFHITLASAPEGKWTSEVLFSLGGQDVKCEVKSIRVEDSKLHMVYTFDLQGTQLESTIDGEMSGKKLGGKYKTRVVADSSAVDEGTWETTASM